MLPFTRPGSASLLSLDDQAPATFTAPPPTGLACPPLWVRTTRTAFGACTGDGWLATGGYDNLNADVAPCFAGLSPAQWHQVRGDFTCAGHHRGAVPPALLAPHASPLPLHHA